MIPLAVSNAVKVDFGLGVTFIGIGALVTIIIAFIMFQIRGERRENLEYHSSRRRGEL